MCDWGPECLKLKKLFAEAEHISQMRMIPIKHGASSDANVALRSLVKFLFKLGPEHDNADFHVAAHHWPPALIERNYKGSKDRAPRQFKTLLTRLEAASYNCAMDVTSNNFASCLKRAGVSIKESDERRLLFVQGPANTLCDNVRSYFGGLTDHRAIRIRRQLHAEQIHEQLAVPEAVSSASLLPNATTTASLPVLPLSPETISPASLCSNCIRDRHLKFDDQINRGHSNVEPAMEGCETTDKGKNKRLGSCRRR
jgi:hypothetical protein